MHPYSSGKFLYNFWLHMCNFIRYYYQHYNYFGKLFVMSSLFSIYAIIKNSLGIISQFSAVAQSCPTLRPHGLQHTKPPCPSPTHRIYLNSCALGLWFQDYMGFKTLSITPLWDHLNLVLVCGVAFWHFFSSRGASLIAQLVKNPPAMRETWVQSLGWEDPLEKGKAIDSSILAWRIPWTI